jgi:hypothetical protein
MRATSRDYDEPMNALEVTFAVLGIAAGLAMFAACSVIAWKALKGPPP